MKVDFLENVIMYEIVLVLVVIIRIFLDGVTQNEHLEQVLIPKEKKLEYKVVEVKSEETVYEKPEFNIKEINELIDQYISEHECLTFEYNIFKIDDDKINIYENCGVPKNTIYDYKEKREVEFVDLIKNKEDFELSVTNLLNLKYPKFVSEQVFPLYGDYNIDKNQITAYYKTSDFGIISIKINNNEIKDMMNYNMEYDEVYDNETYTLDPNKKTIAFTFDDGPSTYDLNIIDYLVDSHSSATFFLVGNRINNFKSSVNKMIEYNMEIGNHSYDHKQLTKLSFDGVKNELDSTNRIFNNLTNKNIYLFRPPYGSFRNSYLASLNVPSILWSLDTLDWQSRNTDKVFNKIIENVEDGDIVLMHSLYPTTAEAVKRVLPELYKNGYQIVSVGKLFQLKGKTIEAGNSYTSAR